MATAPSGWYGLRIVEGSPGGLMLVATFALVDDPPRRPDRPSRLPRLPALVATILGIALTGVGVALRRRR